MAEEAQARAKKVEQPLCIWRGRHEHIRWTQRQTSEGTNGAMYAAVPGETIKNGDRFTPTNREAYSFKNLIELNGRLLSFFTDLEMEEAFGVNEADPDGSHWTYIRNTLVVS